MGLRASHVALLRGLLVVAVMTGATACQRILGIHGGGRAMDAGPADAPDDRAMVRDLAASEVPSDGAVSDQTPADARDAPLDEAADSAARDSREDAAADVGAAPDAADGGSSADRAIADGGGDTLAADGGLTDAVAMGDAAGCAPPWHAENVQARLLTPGTSATACSVAAVDIPALAAAVDTATFRGAQACGACLRVQGTLSTNSVVVPVVERSDVSGLLLTRAAMDQITPGGSLIMVDWQVVACDTRNQPLRYYVKEGSNAGYVGVQIRNARYPIATVAAVGSATSVALALQPYNYWESTQVGGGPLTLRVTDINGQIVTDQGIRVVPQTETTGQGQFPLCR